MNASESRRFDIPVLVLLLFLPALLHAADTAPMQAVQASTKVGAELLEWGDRVGTIEAGKLADIIAVAGNPLEVLSEFERVIFVMKGGEVVKAP
jgi:imidazolonepropionase-like amidohydrolase